LSKSESTHIVTISIHIVYLSTTTRRHWKTFKIFWKTCILILKKNICL